MVGLSEDDWGTLLQRIAAGRCTPFLGAGASFPQMPLGGDVAREWAKSCGYPFQDSASDLPGVAQYLAIQQRDPLGPKIRIEAELSQKPPPNFGVHGQPHGVLASLPLPVYLTTNYDDFMAQALRVAAPIPRDPLVRVAPWTDSAFIPDEMKPGKRDKPTAAHPVVFHLHGHISVVDSMVLTEDDYVDFLVRLGQHRDQLLPPFVQGAFTGNSLLFLGYRLSDWNFRVIHRALLGGRPHSQDPLHVTVQMEPDSSDVSEYLSKYYGRMDLQVYWGSAEKFCAELQDRWAAR